MGIIHDSDHLNGHGFMAGGINWQQEYKTIAFWMHILEHTKKYEARKEIINFIRIIDIYQLAPELGAMQVKEDKVWQQTQESALT